MNQIDQADLTWFIAELHRTISRERLDAYRRTQGDDFDMIATYFWNLALSESLYSTIAVFEVAIRNSIHMALSSAYSSPAWYEEVNLLEQRELSEIGEVRSDLVRHGRAATDGRIIAGLRFVFWEWMFNRPYESKIWYANNLALLKAAFPNLPTSLRKRTTIELRCRAVRQLRNRIAHSEPTWNRPNLQQQHSDIVEAVGWISLPTRDMLVRIDRFRDVYHNGRMAVESYLK